MFQKYGQHDQSFIADTVADLAELPKVNMGSTCYVIEAAEKYMINSKGEWILQMSYRSENQNGGSSGGTAPNLSAYATIAYSDAEDAKLKKYVDEQDEATLQLTDEHVAAAMAEEGELKTAVETVAIEVLSETDLNPAWGSIGG